jgi:hypothetical protein
MGLFEQSKLAHSIEIETTAEKIWEFLPKAVKKT